MSVLSPWCMTTTTSQITSACVIIVACKCPVSRTASFLSGHVILPFFLSFARSDYFLALRVLLDLLPCVWSDILFLTSVGLTQSKPCVLLHWINVTSLQHVQLHCLLWAQPLLGFPVKKLGKGLNQLIQSNSSMHSSISLWKLHYATFSLLFTLFLHAGESQGWMFSGHWIVMWPKD